MASTVVYGCDWCSEIVPKKQVSEEPRYAAMIATHYRDRGMVTAVEEEICGNCLQALEALRKGRYRRG
jgi:hypothetical protein